MQAMGKRLAAEAFGTFWLVFGGVGAALFSGGNYVAIALAFGLTVLTMVYAVGHISGGHFNPAVTIGLAAGRRFAWADVVPYIVSQIVGAIVAAAVLFAIAEGSSQYNHASDGLGANGWGSNSAGGFGLWAALIAEVVLTAFFLYVILGATDTRAPRGFAGLAIGLALTLIHLVAINIDGTSVNPARSIGPALFAGGGALGQVWLFIVAPVVGALIAGASYAVLFGDKEPEVPLQEAVAA